MIKISDYISDEFDECRKKLSNSDKKNNRNLFNSVFKYVYMYVSCPAKLVSKVDECHTAFLNPHDVAT
jgi:hypothetical protein